MNISDIIVLLLFIVPGVIVEKISYAMDIPSSGKRSEFREIINGLVYSLPIILITGLIMIVVNDMSTIDELMIAFNDVEYVLKFAIYVVLLAIAFGVIKGLCKDDIQGAINIIRTKLLNKIAIDDKSCWRNVFLNEKESQYVEVIKNGEKHSGFTKWYSLPNEDREIVLYFPEGLDKHPEYEKCFNKVKQTYIDLEKDIVIKDYDMKEYHKWCDEIDNKK